MNLTKKQFKKALYENEPIVEVGVIRLEAPKFYIYYDYVNDVFTNFDDHNIVMTDYQLDLTRKYFNRILENR